jgi:adenylate cyclase
MADDERATVRTLTDYREIFTKHVEAHQGRVVDTAGDSVLATFDSVVEAVEAAVEVQAALAIHNEALTGARKMHFRIGVNLGDIIVREDGTIYGDGVNIAARLESLADPGGIMVADIAAQAIEGKLEASLQDAGEHAVKNIAKPVRAWRVVTEREGAVEAAPVKTLRRPKVIAGLAAAAAVIIGLAVWGLTTRVEAPQMVQADGSPTDDPVLAIPTGPTIAVLPFRNVGDNPEQTYFVDGLTDDIINGLTKFHDIRVVARDSTMEYQGEAIDVRQVGEALDADYLVQGSIRRFRDLIKVTVQIQDAKQGATIWADTYERTLTAAELFQLQVEIANQVIATVGEPWGIVPLKAVSGAHGKDTATLKGYDCILQTYEFYRSFREEDHATVRECLERTIVESPRYADAWAWLAYVYNEEHAYNFNARPDPLDRALNAAKQAIELDPTNFAGWGALADTYFFRREIDAFFQAGEKAISLNPNDSTRVALIGGFMAWSGDWDRGLKLVGKAIQLNPNHPGWVHMFSAANSYRLRRYDEALSWVRKINMPGSIFEKLWGAVAHAQLGNVDAAREHLDDALALEPNYLKDPRGELSKYFAEPAFIDHVVEGLEKAGLFDEPEAPSRPVIAVLPFDNMSNDPAQNFFAQGLAADISTAFTSFDLRVVASQTAAAAVGDRSDMADIIAALEADYVVTGSVRRSHDSLRLAVQLIEGTNGSQVWGQTFDADMSISSVFELMDDVTELITAQIAGEFGAINTERISRLGNSTPANMSSYDCYLKAVAYGVTLSPEDHNFARLCLEKALESDQAYSNGWALLAIVYADDVLFGFNTVEGAADLALETGHRAVQLGPKNQTAYFALSMAYMANGNRDGFVNSSVKAAGLNPNDGTLLASLGTHLVFAGEYEVGKELLDRGQHLNPHIYPWINLGYSDYFLRQGDFRSALEFNQKCLAEDPDNPGALISHISILGRLGRASEARASIEKLESVWPNIAPNIGAFLGQYFFSDTEKIGNYLEGMREAGYTKMDRVN